MGWIVAVTRVAASAFHSHQIAFGRVAVARLPGRRATVAWHRGLVTALASVVIAGHLVSSVGHLVNEHHGPAVMQAVYVSRRICQDNEPVGRSLTTEEKLVQVGRRHQSRGSKFSFGPQTATFIGEWAAEPVIRKSSFQLIRGRADDAPAPIVIDIVILART